MHGSEGPPAVPMQAGLAVYVQEPECENDAPPPELQNQIPLPVGGYPSYSFKGDDVMNALRPRNKTGLSEAIRAYLSQRNESGSGCRSLSVQNPWAMLLVLGHKTAEFRKPGPKCQIPRPVKGEWVMIIASSANPNLKALSLAEEDYVRGKDGFGGKAASLDFYNDVMSFFNTEKKKKEWTWPRQSCVGLVKFSNITESPTTQTHPWMHEADLGQVHAWDVEDAVLFPETIPNVVGCLVLRQALGPKGLPEQDRIHAKLVEWMNSGMDKISPYTPTSPTFSPSPSFS